MKRNKAQRPRLLRSLVLFSLQFLRIRTEVARYDIVCQARVRVMDLPQKCTLSTVVAEASGSNLRNLASYSLLSTRLDSVPSPFDMMMKAQKKATLHIRNIPLPYPFRLPVTVRLTRTLSTYMVNWPTSQADS